MVSMDMFGENGNYVEISSRKIKKSWMVSKAIFGGN